MKPKVAPLPEMRMKATEFDATMRRAFQTALTPNKNKPKATSQKKHKRKI